MDVRYLIPFFDPKVQTWAIEARLLRWLTFLWLSMGLVILFSASYANAATEYGDSLYFFKRQLIWVLAGMLVFNVVVYSPLYRILQSAKVGVILILSLLLLTLIPGIGTTINGATRWISLGSVIIQPSELIKPFLVLQAAYLFSKWNNLSWLVRISWLSIFSLVLGSILLQPNLSTTALCGIIIWFIAFAAGLPYFYLGGIAVAGFLLATISVSINDYQRSRVLSFTNPWVDPMGDGYQLVQSLLAIASGDIWGRGFGLSQQKLHFLPIPYSDFIFSVYAEEFGFVGALVLLLLLVVYSVIALKVAFKARLMEHQLVAIGVMVALVGQSLLNIGVATGVLPTTGLPLPMFSYGGSSMISSLLLAGLLVRVAREENQAEVLILKERRLRRRRSVP
ncbi:MAG: FtsW/RodA/SpoVE family cell cycle protein [Trichodesmium sp. St16_bin4-tuft]|nr:FtsW/RodA/SpoVE family cell cycle protein [Trichodesmium sp. MAG_R01]MDE5068059.1 FtsW/RodA/SpoVE family cell cycle protein [Trichodesmium sp. St4_bin8_1]MDE5070931.1 FtsW/RodA/SpoVE family cell cycle protein [Trichodesmium sp. St5_bin8]MDE5077618.1 FtsW/RodA/SpoVE family cell cycle protein [Trichodesmium sp. St2_bin6]MDE5098936.1 FtsW/RodA/SpoVE family cell cycle protein [Trichodesmium sp. St16_bin4-tuft]MDE5105224.1 FtsW/RodA/SpoVE family cell cycle protein [Trichodesmium sp. St19_bin2]